MKVAAQGEGGDDPVAPQVVADEQGDQKELQLQPRLTQVVRRGEDHGEAKDRGEERADAHDDEQPPLHEDETLDAERIAGGRVVHKEARQIEQSCEPSDDEYDVKCLEPEHDPLAYRAEAMPGIQSSR